MKSKTLTKDDKKIWNYVTKSVTPLGQSEQNLLNSNASFNMTDVVNSFKPPKKSKPNHTPVVDLHGLTINEAYQHLLSIIDNYYMRGIKQILIITGKGGVKNGEETGALKREVPLWFETSKFQKYISTYNLAPRNEGGEGALYVFLKN